MERWIWISSRMHLPPGLQLAMYEAHWVSVSEETHSPPGLLLGQYPPQQLQLYLDLSPATQFPPRSSLVRTLLQQQHLHLEKCGQGVLIRVP